ncbi:hypothetical protein LRB11_13570 [Ectothiorhodospira haloalkaliphila]|uniref:hypothetical protein n=1 Tax=Ectothiorhodospira haloalkaliphila TaxID=421628 RepID=UPI001EE8CDE4|nr:hypothetical protein [Ectothiorhodospira haloalkaliphila]MCG5525948.1 hypothetical protein [Ectothiorhodospira haloalkaliphila]
MTRPEDFCKLFHHPTHGQILILLDEGADDGPLVRIHCRPAGFSVCCLDYPHPESDEGLKKARELFHGIGEEEASAIAAGMVAHMTEADTA